SPQLFVFFTKIMLAGKRRLRYRLYGCAYFSEKPRFEDKCLFSDNLLASKMGRMYPEVVTAIGNVEGYPELEDVIELLNLYGVKKIILKPFMVVAGDHSINDMASGEEDSWKSILVPYSRIPVIKKQKIWRVY
ncbi:MAG: hypothetical protein GY799_26480, partial [Desulfobulbaceae bacterium]|nr:hypothetical protein [Desulfobulbaceae bacterium]